MRLNVFLSHNGAGSRRETFDLVKMARVKVNGQVIVEPSMDVGEQDEITVDGRPVKAQGYVYLMLNKAAGYVSTKFDPHADRIVGDLLPKQYRHLSPVGRLDRDTEGLMLFTNDGAVAQKLLHPKFEKDKTYHVFVEGRISEDERRMLESGVMIDEEQTAPAKVKIQRSSAQETECLVTIHEGKKRQIRRMMDVIGHPVIALKRLTFGPLKLGDLKVGSWRLLTPEEVKQLKQL